MTGGMVLVFVLLNSLPLTACPTSVSRYIPRSSPLPASHHTDKLSAPTLKHRSPLPPPPPKKNIITGERHHTQALVAPTPTIQEGTDLQEGTGLQEDTGLLSVLTERHPAAGPPAPRPP